MQIQSPQVFLSESIQADLEFDGNAYQSANTLPDDDHRP